MSNIFRVLVLLIVFYNGNAWAWDDEKTHQDLSGKAAEKSVLSLTNGDYLKNLGFSNNLNETFILNGEFNTVIEWIKNGSLKEDAGNFLNGRYYNHFHDPTKAWDQAGLSTIYPGVNGESSVLWAQDSSNEWSWQEVRDYYYLALTSQIETDRNTNFANTFKGLGHIIHLIQDTSQPAHVRNDPHGLEALGLVEGFESWAVTNRSQVSSLMSNAIYPTVSLNTSLGGYVPITQLFDTDQFDGTNPSASLSQGLAEYTNANFFSEDTIFDSNFTYPSRNDMQYYEEPTGTSWMGMPLYRKYYRKTDGGEQIEHAAYLGRFYRYFGNVQLFPSATLGLDDQCYSDYAQKLLPRAVGYSAGLLNYFFRGDIDLQEDTSSGSGYIIVNNAEEEMQGTFEIYYDKISYDNEGNRSDQRTLLWSSSISLGTNSSGNNKSQNIYVSEPSDAAEPGKYILVFSGRLGNEQDAKVGKVISFPNLYIMVMPVNHETRETEAKQYYSMKVTDSNNSTVTLTQTTETSLPFSLLDDGAYWDSMSLSWTATTSPESLGAPLGNGGPQYFAKYHDIENNRIRFVPNLTYEKEAWLAFDASYSGIKEMHYVNYIGSPLFGFGMYNANTGWMEYTDSGLYTILSPAGEPKQRLFSLYKGNNFNDTFVETPYLRFYDFNGANSYETAIPKDPDAPFSSVVSAYMPAGESYVKVSTPKVYNSYVKPNPYWANGMSTASSGVQYYRLYSNMEPVYETEEKKCTAEDNNCGNTGTNGSSVNTVFDIPYNFNSYIRVHRNDGGNYYEEMYINGNLLQSSTPSTKLETHYQILAVYKDTALIRETNYVSEGNISLPYSYQYLRIYEENWNFTSKYYIYTKGTRYDLTGTTDIKTRYLAPHNESASGVSPVNYLTYEPVDDITGFHIDRISISETFDGSHTLIAFDEYSYNNGQGLTHDLRYEQSDSNNGKYILYYDIPKTEIQNADHEAARTGRKLLLFKGDGTFKQELQDPIGLDKTIGSIGILN